MKRTSAVVPTAVALCIMLVVMMVARVEGAGTRLSIKERLMSADKSKWSMFNRYVYHHVNIYWGHWYMYWNDARQWVGGNGVEQYKSEGVASGRLTGQAAYVNLRRYRDGWSVGLHHGWAMKFYYGAENRDRTWNNGKGFYGGHLSMHFDTNGNVHFHRDVYFSKTTKGIGWLGAPTELLETEETVTAAPVTPEGAKTTRASYPGLDSDHKKGQASASDLQPEDINADGDIHISPQSYIADIPEIAEDGDVVPLVNLAKQLRRKVELSHPSQEPVYEGPQLPMRRVTGWRALALYMTKPDPEPVAPSWIQLQERTGSSMRPKQHGETLSATNTADKETGKVGAAAQGKVGAAAKGKTSAKSGSTTRTETVTKSKVKTKWGFHFISWHHIWIYHHWNIYYYDWVGTRRSVISNGGDSIVSFWSNSQTEVATEFRLQGQSYGWGMGVTSDGSLMVSWGHIDQRATKFRKVMQIKKDTMETTFFGASYFNKEAYGFQNDPVKMMEMLQTDEKTGEAADADQAADPGAARPKRGEYPAQYDPERFPTELSKDPEAPPEYPGNMEQERDDGTCNHEPPPEKPMPPVPAASSKAKRFYKNLGGPGRKPRRVPSGPVRKSEAARSQENRQPAPRMASSDRTTSNQSLLQEDARTFAVDSSGLTREHVGRVIHEKSRMAKGQHPPKGFTGDHPPAEYSSEGRTAVNDDPGLAKQPKQAGEGKISTIGMASVMKNDKPGDMNSATSAKAAAKTKWWWCHWHNCMWNIGIHNMANSINYNRNNAFREINGGWREAQWRIETMAGNKGAAMEWSNGSTGKYSWKIAMLPNTSNMFIVYGPRDYASSRGTVALELSSSGKIHFHGHVNFIGKVYGIYENWSMRDIFWPCLYQHLTAKHEWRVDMAHKWRFKKRHVAVADCWTHHNAFWYDMERDKQADLEHEQYYKFCMCVGLFPNWFDGPAHPANVKHGRVDMHGDHAMALRGIKKGKNIPGNMQITSTAYGQWGTMPTQYTCRGGNAIPPMNFEQVPTEAKTLAIIFEEYSSSQRKYLGRWGKYNIPLTVTSSGSLTPTGCPECKTAWTKFEDVFDWKNVLIHKNFGQYAGPCPTGTGGGYVYYRFTLYALDNKTRVGHWANTDTVKWAMKGHVLKRARYWGRVERAAS